MSRVSDFLRTGFRVYGVWGVWGQDLGNTGLGVLGAGFPLLAPEGVKIRLFRVLGFKV